MSFPVSLPRPGTCLHFFRAFRVQFFKFRVFYRRFCFRAQALQAFTLNGFLHVSRGHGCCPCPPRGTCAFVFISRIGLSILPFCFFVLDHHFFFQAQPVGGYPQRVSWTAMVTRLSPPPPRDISSIFSYIKGLVLVLVFFIVALDFELKG